MDHPLAGRVILIVDDEPLIAQDVARAVEDAGAETVVAHNFAGAMRALEDFTFCAAIVDQFHEVGDNNSQLRKRLEETNVPYVTYGGTAPDAAAAAYVTKPALAADLVTTIKGLLEPR